MSLFRAVGTNCIKKKMNALFFTKRFPDETARKEHYMDIRINQGLTAKDVEVTSISGWHPSGNSNLGYVISELP